MGIVYRVKVCADVARRHAVLAQVGMLMYAWVQGPSRGFLQLPSSALTLVDGQIPREEWPVLAIVGLYLREYERRFRRKWRGGQVGLAGLYEDVEAFVAAWDVATAIGAIEVVFSDRMKWVTGDHMRFLQNQSNMTRFVVPLVAEAEEKRVGRGEQAEWAGARASAGSREVRL